MKLFEVKFEISEGEEKKWIERLGLEFEREYTDTDTYLESDGPKTLKIKTIKEGSIYYQISVKEDVFEIIGKKVTNEEKRKILLKTPIADELNRTKRVFLWDGFKTKCAFDYIEELEPKVFMEVYANDRTRVKNAMDYIKGLGLGKVVSVAYNKLLK